MTGRALLLLAFGLAFASLLTGCGGGQGASASNAAETTTLTKAEFIKKADEICRKADISQDDKGLVYRNKHARELEKLPPIAAEEKLIVAIIIPSIRQQAKEMEALGAPKGEGKKLESFVAGIEAGLKRAEKHPYHIEWEYPTQNPFFAVDEALGKYGFAYCSNMS
jgi:hypothetical protein